VERLLTEFGSIGAAGVAAPEGEPKRLPRNPGGDVVFVVGAGIETTFDTKPEGREESFGSGAVTAGLGAGIATTFATKLGAIEESFGSGATTGGGGGGTGKDTDCARKLGDTKDERDGSGTGAAAGFGMGRGAGGGGGTGKDTDCATKLGDTRDERDGRGTGAAAGFGMGRGAGGGGNATDFETSEDRDESDGSFGAGAGAAAGFANDRSGNAPIAVTADSSPVMWSNPICRRALVSVPLSAGRVNSSSMR
jgi:hypothetical protein